MTASPRKRVLHRGKKHFSFGVYEWLKTRSGITVVLSASSGILTWSVSNAIPLLESHGRVWGTIAGVLSVLARAMVLWISDNRDKIIETYPEKETPSNVVP